jgi:hypothetical protein
MESGAFSCATYPVLLPFRSPKQIRWPRHANLTLRASIGAQQFAEILLKI